MREKKHKFILLIERAITNSLKITVNTELSTGSGIKSCRK